MTDGSGSTQWRYDEVGNVLSKTQTLNAEGSANALVTSYTYEQGRLKTKTYPSQVLLTYSYDDAGNLTQIDGAHKEWSRLLYKVEARQPFGALNEVLRGQRISHALG